MPVYNPHDYPKCPHCGKEMEDPAGDHVIPGRSGAASRSHDFCGYCEGGFTAERLTDGSGYVEIKKKED